MGKQMENEMESRDWGFPKARGSTLGVSIIRMIVFGGSILGSPYLGNYHIHPLKVL